MAANLDSVVLRDARPDELEEVSSLMQEAYKGYFVDVPPEVEASAARYLAEIGDVWSRLDDSELVVAEEDGRLVGAVTFFPDGTRAEGDGWPEGWSGIRLLAVLPEARGRGIGRVLTEECLERARARGAVTVGLHTTAVMMVAKGMYERMGFERVPELDFNPSPRTQVIAYKLDLEPRPL